MDVVSTPWCGIDVGKQEVVACLIVPGEAGRAKQTIRRFWTMTEDLEALGPWLREVGGIQVAMERTGGSWPPGWTALEAGGGFELRLVNARHGTIVPGRKPDVNDAEGVADLVRHALVRGSFAPDRDQRELREFTR